MKLCWLGVLYLLLLKNFIWRVCCLNRVELFLLLLFWKVMFMILVRILLRWYWLVRDIGLLIWVRIVYWKFWLMLLNVSMFMLCWLVVWLFWLFCRFVRLGWYCLSVVWVILGWWWVVWCWNSCWLLYWMLIMWWRLFLMGCVIWINGYGVRYE